MGQPSPTQEALEFAWACGLFEGEGTLLYSPGTRGGTATLALSSTDEDVVRRFGRIMGFGWIYGPYQPSTGGRKMWWRWNATGWKKVAATFERFEPYLGIRRRNRFIEVLSHRPPSSPRCEQDPNEPTQRGYARHKKRGEPPCDNCRSAKAFYMLAWRERK